MDLSAAAVKKLRFVTPDKQVLEKTASFTTNGSDGQIQYITQTGDLSVAGIWTVCAYIEIGNWKGHTSKESFVVAEI